MKTNKLKKWDIVFAWDSYDLYHMTVIFLMEFEGKYLCVKSWDEYYFYNNMSFSTSAWQHVEKKDTVIKYIDWFNKYEYHWFDWVEYDEIEKAIKLLADSGKLKDGKILI